MENRDDSRKHVSVRLDPDERAMLEEFRNSDPDLTLSAGAALRFLLRRGYRDWSDDNRNR